MTYKEILQATDALFLWFENQDIEMGDAANVCTVALAAIIGDTVGRNRRKRREGVLLIASQIDEILADHDHKQD